MTDSNSRKISRSCSSLAIAFMYSGVPHVSSCIMATQPASSYGSVRCVAEIARQMCYHQSLPGSFFKMPDLNASFWKSLLLTATCLALLSACPAVYSQEAFGDDATDPVRLFERGQSAHARGELEKAIGFYEQALKVRPEFPEAEFQ